MKQAQKLHFDGTHIFPWAPLLFAGVLVGLTLLVNEWMAAHFLSSDGVLSSKYRVLFGGLDLFLFVCAVFCVLAPRRILSLLGGKGRRANELACVMVFIMFGLTLVLLEGSVDTIMHLKSEVSPYVRERSPDLMAPDALLGHRAKANAVFEEIYTTSNDSIFKTTYTFDDFQRRITPTNSAETAEQFMMLMGGSFAMGTGVEDDETMAARISALDKATAVYNYGQPGDGPHQSLTILNKWDLNSQIPEHSGYCIYVFIPQHIPRAIGTMRHAVSWGSQEPAFGMDKNGNVQYLGSYESAFPLRMLLYRMLAQEQVLQYLNLDLPPVVLDKHIEYTAKLLKAMEKRFSEQFDNLGFYVLLHPLYEDSAISIDQIREIFNEYDLEMLDYYDIALSGKRGDWFFENDMHPKATLHDLIAGQVVNDLNKNMLYKNRHDKLRN